MKSVKQIEFNLNKGTIGGRRKNSGRKRIHSKGVAHRKREKVTRNTPVHINFKINGQIKNKECLKLLKRAIQNAFKYDLHVVHYSLQSNHVHLVAHAPNNQALARGMQSLGITFSKGLGPAKKFLGRYHLHVLRTVREVKHAISYVLFNEQKHSGQKRIDEFSSLVGMKEAHRLISKFAVKFKRSLIVGRFEIETRTYSDCYLLVRGLNELM